MSNGDTYWSLVDPIWEAVSIYDGPERFFREFNAASVAPRNLLAAHWCQSEVRNGGLHQFFGNATGVLAPEAVAAFRLLNMPHIASTIEQAMAWFGSHYPRDRKERTKALSSHRKSHPNKGSPFDSLDEAFFEHIYSENGGFECAADAYALAQNG